MFRTRYRECDQGRTWRSWSPRGLRPIRPCWSQDDTAPLGKGRCATSHLDALSHPACGKAVETRRACVHDPGLMIRVLMSSQGCRGLLRTSATPDGKDGSTRIRLSSNAAPIQLVEDQLC